MAIELEMDDTLSTKQLTAKEREREWKGLRDLAISVCDDYHPDVLRYNTRAMATASRQSSYTSEGQFHYHDETRDDRVGRNHVVCVKNQRESNGVTTCCQSESKGQTASNSPVVQAKGWQPQGQSYSVQQWNEQIKRKVNEPVLGCMMAATNRPGGRQRRDDHGSEGDDDELICNMTGQAWESFPFPIIIDSGACASVMPASWCDHVPLQEIPQSKAGDYYRAANGNKIYHEGEKLISMMIQEGALRDMKFTVCDVSKALGSVSLMCKAGHRVVFNPAWSNQGSYIEHISIGERLWLQEEGGLYILKTKVAPTHRQTSRWNAQDFRRQVQSP